MKIKDELIAIIDRHALAPKQETPIAGLTIFKPRHFRRKAFTRRAFASFFKGARRFRLAAIRSTSMTPSILLPL
ncbi:hypothetical protein LVY75_33350 (plasmid) [Sinorhizobium sp. B11]